MGRRPAVEHEVAAIVGAQATVDPELAERARALGDAALTYAERVFREGHPDAKREMMKLILPALMKTEKAEEDDERVALRKKLDEIYKDAGLGQ